MRIAYLVPSLGLTEGQGNADHELLRRIARAGHDVDVYAGNAPASVSSLSGVRLHRIPRLPAWQLGNQMLQIATTSARLRRSRFDLVHADAGVTARRVDVMVCHTVTDRWYDLPASVWHESGARGAHLAAATRFKAAFELRGLRAARAVIANSTMTAEDLEARGVDPERITVLPFGVDTERFHQPSAEDRALARASFGLHERDFVVLFVGAHGPRKGLPQLIEALSGRADMRLLAVGDTRGGAFVRDAAARGLRAVMPGKLADVRRAYWAADVLAYPSRYDAFGMAVLEAMACGLPVVVTAGAGAAEIVRDAGTVLPDADPRALGAALDAIRDESDMRRAMGARGRSIALGHLWDKAGDILLEVYTRLTDS